MARNENFLNIQRSNSESLPLRQQLIPTTGQLLHHWYGMPDLRQPVLSTRHQWSMLHGRLLRERYHSAIRLLWWVNH